MKVQEEKALIYSMMKDITAERRKLTDTYYGLKERLDYLIGLEQMGIDTLSIQGYVDIYTQNQKEAIVNNIKREAEHQIDKIENSHIIEEREKSPIPHEEIQRQKENHRKQRRGRINREKIASAVAEVLKEQGSPMKLNDLYEKLNEHLDFTLNKGHFQNNLLPKVMEINPKIERPMKGFYQYRY